MIPIPGPRRRLGLAAFFLGSVFTFLVLLGSPPARLMARDDQPEKQEADSPERILSIPTRLSHKETLGNKILTDDYAYVDVPFTVTWRFKDPLDARDFRTAILKYRSNSGSVIFWHMVGNPSTNSVTGTVSVSFRPYRVPSVKKDASKREASKREAEDDRGTGKGTIIVTQHPQAKNAAAKLVDYVLDPEKFDITLK